MDFRSMREWLEMFVAEKGISGSFEIEGESGINHIPLECLIDAIVSAPPMEQKIIKHNLVRLDFLNGDCRGYFEHLCKAIAI